MIGFIYNKKTFKNVVFCKYQVADKQPYQLTFKDAELIKLIQNIPNYSIIKLIEYSKSSTALKYKELKVDKFECVNKPIIPIPFEWDKINSVASNKVNLSRVFALRSSYYKTILKNRAEIKYSLAKSLYNLGFIAIDSPKIIKTGLETSGAEMFKINYYNKIYSLTQSPQMYKQILVNTFDKVYEIGTIFRAEPSDSLKHLAEINTLDIELVTTDLIDILQICTLCIHNVLKHLKMQWEQDDFKVFKYTKIVEMLNLKSDYKQDFSSNQLQNLNLPKWYYITEYPNEIRPFYTKGTDSFDLYYQTTEIASGSLRIHQYEELIESCKRKNINIESLNQYMDNFRYGSKPHGGLGLGIDRLVKVLLDITNIMDTVAFPRSYTNII
jgi:nondiscriminating aspartyl-tRNA synthetase